MVREGYKQTEAGVIPVDWEVVTVDDVTNVLTGFPFASSKYSKSGTKLLRGSNVKRNTLDWSTHITKYWSEITPDIQHYLLEDGDVVIAMDGSLVGKSFAQVSKVDLPLLLLQRVARLRALSIDIGYLKELICSPIFTKHCDEVKTVTAIPHISPADIKGYLIPLPPTLTEQRAIAGALSDTDVLLSALDALIGKKEAFKRGMMEGLLSGERRLEGFDGEWKKCTTADIGIVASGRSSTFDHGSGFPIYGSTGQIGMTPEADYAGEAILIARVGANAGNVYSISGKYSVSDNTLIYRLTDGTSFDFLAHLFSSFNLNNLVYGSGQPLVTGTIIKSLELSLPPLPEQRAIARVLSDLDAELSGLRARRAKLGLVKGGMMGVLLSGGVRLV